MLIPLPPANTRLQKHNRITHKLQRFVAPKPDLDAKAENDDFEAFLKRNFKRKIINAKMKKSSAKAPIQTFIQPLQCDLRLSDAKQNSSTLAAAAARKLDAAIPLRSADTELQSAIELRAAAPQIAAVCSSKTGSRLKHFLKGILENHPCQY